MRARARPYSTKGIIELEALKQLALVDPLVRDDLLFELSCRKSSRAKALLQSLSGNGPAPEAEVPVADGAVVTVQSLYDQLHLLRSTFSEVGEILARWGLTESMPRDMRDQVIAMWRELLGSGPTTHGRSLERLEVDIRSIADIEGQSDRTMHVVAKKKRGS